MLAWSLLPLLASHGFVFGDNQVKEKKRLHAWRSFFPSSFVLVSLLRKNNNKIVTEETKPMLFVSYAQEKKGHYVSLAKETRIQKPTRDKRSKGYVVSLPMRRKRRDTKYPLQKKRAYKNQQGFVSLLGTYLLGTFKRYQQKILYPMRRKKEKLVVSFNRR